MIRVLIAEDSVTVREFLVAVLSADPEIEVVGQAKNGREAVEMAKRLKPDIVTMDVNMPVMDGLQATKQIMIETPAPIVIVSGTYDTHEIEVSMQALRMGALAVIEKPGAPGSPGFKADCQRLIDTVKTMADVKVVHHRPILNFGQVREAELPVRAQDARLRIVGIAASTGGPAALQTILSNLPADYPVPILIVQHIGEEFAQGLSAWLRTICPLRVKTSEHGEPIEPSTVYIAAGNRHLGAAANGTIVHSDEPAIGGFRPSATYLFRSLGQAYEASALGIVLTGMGRDGADGLDALKAHGGQILAQDEATSVVFGMPAAAIETGHVDAVLPLDAIVPQLLKLA